MKLPTLYKKTSTGAIQFWEIDTGEYDGVAFINTTYGQLGTDSPQTTADYIQKGKNIGKKNETTPMQQAQLEAKARWKKQLKKGYVESIEAAQSGAVSEEIQGGVDVMLAKTYSKDGHKIVYPAYISPKLDGLRCVAIVKDGVCTLWSRTRKLITSMPQIVSALEKLNYNAIFDGEIYANTHSNNFEEIVSLVRQKSPDQNCNKMQYHIFDMVNNLPYSQRLQELKTIVSNLKSQYVIAVESNLVHNEEEALEYFDKFLEQKFEGAMIRNKDSCYTGKRSSDLQKIKEFEDDEFEIIGIEEGRGKLAGHVGAFVCITKEGLTFKAKMMGATRRLKDYFDDYTLWKGKLLTVKYQALTSYGIPRFPVGKSVRIE